MKVKYLAALVAVSVFSVGTLASCGPEAEVEPDATEEIAPEEGAMEEPVMEEEGAMEEPVEPVEPETAE